MNYLKNANAKLAARAATSRQPIPVEAIILHHFDAVRTDPEIQALLPATYVQDLREAFGRQAKAHGQHPSFPLHPDELDALEKKVLARIASMGVEP